MRNPSEIVEFLRARLAEDEWWAREASRLRDQEGEPAGDHWQWQDGDSDRVLPLDPAQSEYIGAEHGGVRVSLRSRELYPTDYVGDLPNFAISSAEEVPTTVGGHIVRHDPARVLEDGKSKRSIVDAYVTWSALPQAKIADHKDGFAAGLLAAVEALAATYSDHPDYEPGWRL